MALDERLSALGWLRKELKRYPPMNVYGCRRSFAYSGCSGACPTKRSAGSSPHTPIFPLAQAATSSAENSLPASVSCPWAGEGFPRSARSGKAVSAAGADNGLFDERQPVQELFDLAVRDVAVGLLQLPRVVAGLARANLAVVYFHDRGYLGRRAGQKAFVGRVNVVAREHFFLDDRVHEARVDEVENRFPGHALQANRGRRRPQRAGPENEKGF